MIKRAIFICTLFLIGCAATPPKQPTGPVVRSIVQMKNADYRETWFATLAAVKKFPFTRIEKDSGLIDTDWVRKSSTTYLETFGGDPIQQETRVKFHIHIVERFDKPTTRVSITKEEQAESYLPDTYQNIPSDGIMEAILHYRIDRQIEINRRLMAAGLQPLPIKIPQLEGITSVEDKTLLPY